MKKQHLATEIASLINPPLQSKYNQLQLQFLENIYASSRNPLGKHVLQLYLMKQPKGIWNPYRKRGFCWSSYVPSLLQSAPNYV
ncbi:hypothetical protein CEXT_89451 [Caerostris extrusa]|uniref:Uncharacterized protein n=1 Tax=Caerostris extrusa TaxID=172846 RepID=A0AAV4MNG7_CAEEX|nr:hypothetical protein CEXT_89451 [Caerostris extrusa]